MRESSLARFSTAALRPHPNIAPLPAMSPRGTNLSEQVIGALNKALHPIPRPAAPVSPPRESHKAGRFHTARREIF
jgi:hypothetical protein